MVPPEAASAAAGPSSLFKQMAQGLCKVIFPTDAVGSKPHEGEKPLEPQDERAVAIWFRVDDTLASPPQDQLDLKRDIELTLRAVTHLYIVGGVQQPEFRPYYVQLVALAQLGLRGPTAAPEIARRALDSLNAELIDDAGPKVKNGHLGRLAQTGLGLALVCVLLYCLMCVAPAYPPLVKVLARLSIDPVQFSSFMMLWVGCFVGVVLSYGSRTTKMTVQDLIVTDADYLLPLTRHLFAGTLTMILGMALTLGLLEVKIAGVSSAQLISDPMIAFLIGAVCGISELLLPAAVSRKAGTVLGLADGK